MAEVGDGAGTGVAVAVGCATTVVGTTLVGVIGVTAAVADGGTIVVAVGVGSPEEQELSINKAKGETRKSFSRLTPNISTSPAF